MRLPISDAYGMSIISSLSVAVFRSADGSIGEETVLLELISNCQVMVFMNEGCEIWMVPMFLSHVILIPSSLSGVPRSCISKLPLMLQIILSIDVSKSAANKLSSTYHLLSQ